MDLVTGSFWTLLSQVRETCPLRRVIYDIKSVFKYHLGPQEHLLKIYMVIMYLNEVNWRV